MTALGTGLSVGSWDSGLFVNCNVRLFPSFNINCLLLSPGNKIAVHVTICQMTSLGGKNNKENKMILSIEIYAKRKPMD